MTETCEKNQPNLVIHVETRSAPQDDQSFDITHFHFDWKNKKTVPVHNSGEKMQLDFVVLAFYIVKQSG